MSFVDGRRVSHSQFGEKLNTNKYKKGLAAATLLSTATTGIAPGLTVAATLAGAAIYTTVAAHAAEATVTNASATMNWPNQSELEAPLETVFYQLSTKVADGAKGGDTIALDTPDYFNGAKFDNEAITDKNGNVVAYITGGGSAGADYTITLTDFVNGRTDITINKGISLAPVQDNWGGDGKLNDVALLVNGQSVSAGEVKLKYYYPPTKEEGAEGAVRMVTTNGLYDMYSRINTMLTNASDVNQRIYLTETITATDQMTWRCDDLASMQSHLQYNVRSANPGSQPWTFIPTGTVGTGTDVAGDNPFGVQIESCSPTELKLSWVPTAANQTLSVTTQGVNADGLDLGLLQLTDNAIANYIPNQYNISAVGTHGDGSTNPYSITGPYDWNAADADTRVPTASPSATETPSAPVTTEPATTEPATTEPATTEPATTEPATTEPATTEPATTEPATTEPATTAPAVVETTPAPAETTPVVEETTSAPAETTAPAVEETTSAPAVEETTPAAQETTPVAVGTTAAPSQPAVVNNDHADTAAAQKSTPWGGYAAGAGIFLLGAVMVGASVKRRKNS